MIGKYQKYNAGWDDVNPVNALEDTSQNSLHYMQMRGESNDKFKKAEFDSKQIIKKYPDNPAGYFFYASVLNSFMEFLQSEDHENEFYQYCDIAINKGEKLLDKDQNNIWAQFFIAGSNGLKGTYESRYDRWLTAFKHGWRGVVIFKEILKKHPDIHDVNYGLSTYDYWRSAKTKMLWWLPGVEDKRDESISILFSLLELGKYVKENASLSLIDILINEKRYEDSFPVIQKFLNQYPHNLTCWWKKVLIEIEIKNFEEAEKSCAYILERIESGNFDNTYNSMLIHYYYSKLYFLKKQYELCLKELKFIKTIKVTSLSEKRLEDEFKDLASLERKVQRILKK
jgi:tetratricopeptide (TPR) repeat protein